MVFSNGVRMADMFCDDVNRCAAQCLKMWERRCIGTVDLVYRLGLGKVLEKSVVS